MSLTGAFVIRRWRCSTCGRKARTLLPVHDSQPTVCDACVERRLKDGTRAAEAAQPRAPAR